VLDATGWRYAGAAEWSGWQAEWSASRLRQRFVLGAVLAPAGTPPFLEADARQRGLFTHRAEGGGLTLRRAFGAHTLTFGGETLSGRNTRADLQSNYRLAPPFGFLGGYQSSGLRFSTLGARDRMSAAYVEDDWRLSPAHRLVLGLRHDRYAETGSATSPRLGWVWSPDGTRSLKLLYQEAFFAPTLGQRYLQNNPVIAGNPDLDPARVRTWELVGQRQWGNLLWRGSLYHRRAKDGFAVVPGAATTATTVNAVRQRSEGLETTLHWSPSPAWRLRLTASSLLRDDYTLPAALAEAPPGHFVSRRTASALLSWKPGEWEWTLGAHWRSREGFQPRENPPRAMLQGNWRPGNGLRLWLHVDNLFDARGSDIDVAGALGIDPATGEIVRQLPLPGRELLLGFEYRWR
jgi:iron complex outermembrane receptor protein